MQKLQPVLFTIAGTRFELGPEAVEESMSQQEPEPLRAHFVVIGGRRFPPKQALNLLTGLDRSDFTTVQARSIFRRLGFSTGRSIKPSTTHPPNKKSGEFGLLESEADELRPYRGRWVALDDKSVVFSADTPQEVLGWLRRHDRPRQLDQGAAGPIRRRWWFRLLIIPFRGLPGIHGAIPRPLLGVHVDGIDHADLPCLVDSGSLHNRFAAWVASEAGIDLSGVEAVSLGVGGRPTIARTVRVGLRLGEHSWEAPVSFCDPWPWDFNLLGQEGFFRWFKIVFKAADRVLEITPNRR